MLEGLEVSVINIKDLEKGLRFDSEIYQKIYLKYDSFIKQKKYTIFDKEALIVKKGIFDIKSEVYTDVGIPFVRISNLKNMLIDTEGIVFIPQIENDINIDTYLKKGDIILSKTAYPAVSYVNIESCNTSQDTVAIKLKEQSNLLSEYVVTFLNSQIGIKQMQRRFTGNIQMHLNLEDCRFNLLIPVLSITFQQRIKDLFYTSIQKTEDSKLLYNRAEQLLLGEIGLKDWYPSSENINTKSFKESFLSTGRLDAEYYQPRYDDVVTHIKSKPYNRLSSLVTIKKSIEPGSDVYSEEGVPFLRVADYNKFGISKPEKKLSYEFCQDNEDLILDLKPKKETILFSKDGSVGIAYMLREDGNFITSGAILHLTIRDKSIVDPQYLALALNSKLVQMQAERDAGGSIILHWRISEIEKVLVPIIDYSKQLEIADLIEESFTLKQQSEYLLEMAKRAVEIAIENNEEKALEYIKMI